MKILHFITGLQNGGAEGVLVRLILSDNINEHLVVVLTSGAQHVSVLKDSKVDVVLLNYDRGFLFGFWRTLLSLKRLRVYKPNVIQTWMYHADFFGSIFSILLSCPIVWNIRHGEISKDTVKFKTRTILKLCAYLSWYIPRSIVVCSKRSAEVHSAIGYNEKKFIVVPNGVDTNKFCSSYGNAASLRNELKISSDSFVFGFAGRFHSQKGLHIYAKSIDTFLRTLKDDIGKVYFLFVGRGVSSANFQLVSLFSDKALRRCIFLDEQSDMLRYYLALNTLVLPSIAGEGAANVLLEAQACGVPCIATDVGDAHRIVVRPGIVVEPRSSSMLAGALIDMYQHDIVREERERISSLIVRDYSLGGMTRNYQKVWSSATVNYNV